jgi:hypothetical protein
VATEKDPDPLSPKNSNQTAFSIQHQHPKPRNNSTSNLATTAPAISPQRHRQSRNNDYNNLPGLLARVNANTKP